MASVVRVREVNGHRLTWAEARDNLEASCWRVSSWERDRGHWVYAFDDVVLEANLGLYVAAVLSRGRPEKFTVSRMGTVRETLDRFHDGGFKPRAPSFSGLRRTALIDVPSTYRRRRKP